MRHFHPTKHVHCYGTHHCVITVRSLITVSSLDWTFLSLFHGIVKYKSDPCSVTYKIRPWYTFDFWSIVLGQGVSYFVRPFLNRIHSPTSLVVTSCYNSTGGQGHASFLNLDWKANFTLLRVVCVFCNFVQTQGWFNK